MDLPKITDFPEGTTFYTKGFDILLVRIPDNNYCTWFIWFGGSPKEYDVRSLKLGNN